MLRQNELLVVDAKSGEISRRLPVRSPRGVAFDSTGRMLVLTGNQLVAYANPKETKKLYFSALPRLRVNFCFQVQQALSARKSAGVSVPQWNAPAGWGRVHP